MIKPKTIIAESFFGDKTLTKEEFANRWMDHIRELRHLAYDTEWQQEVDSFVEKTRDKAHHEFNRIYWIQNS